MINMGYVKIMSMSTIAYFGFQLYHSKTFIMQHILPMSGGKRRDFQLGWVLCIPTYEMEEVNVQDTGTK